jgi:threonine synthase
VKYVSTRGSAPVLDFGDVLLAGLARDGGLYVPDTWPTFAPGRFASYVERMGTAGAYQEVAVDVMAPYVEGTLTRDELSAMVTDAYGTFDHADVVPVSQLSGGLHLAELFWGPTLAFKDVALQLVGRLFDHELRRRGERVTIVGATSGDTGSAAIEACRDRDAIDIFILHPAGRVSEVQRRQMTTVHSPNVHNLAVEGTFDDCQDMVKALFADHALRDELHLSAVNSINWARVMAQIVYYVTAAAALQGPGGRRISFTVPTGNFGNIFAGYAATRMGAPVGDLVMASNRNDILTRFLHTGEMAITGVHPTLSPSMDIQVSSNLERMLFELYGRDGSALADLMQEFRAEGRVAVEPERLALLREQFVADRLDDEQTLEVMRQEHEASGVLLDPHTAVGVGVARRLVAAGADPTAMVCLATAHPAKFPDAVEQATGVRPALPPRLADLLEREERYQTLPNDIEAVRAHIVSNCVTG